MYRPHQQGPRVVDQSDRAGLGAEHYRSYYRSVLYPLLGRVNAYLMRWLRTLAMGSVFDQSCLAS